MARNIVIYQDEGVGPVGLACLQSFFAKDDVRLVSAPSVIDNSAFEGCDIFVMPGGADRFYAQKLDGTGNNNIRAFVENGGTYLGLCAGAYYACKAIEYHRGRHDEICAPRDLALVDAVAIGSLSELGPYYDETLHSAGIVTLELANGTTQPIFYFGGCKFTGDPDAEILARYDIAGKPAAMIRKKAGRGCVVLSGAHVEYTPQALQNYPAANEQERERGVLLASILAQKSLFDWNHYLFRQKEQS